MGNKSAIALASFAALLDYYLKSRKAASLNCEGESEARGTRITWYM